MKISYKKLLIALPVLLVIVELGVRATKINDFPLYEANSEIGYIPKPSQQGSFLHNHSWEFNSLSMGSGDFKPTESVDTLLIGDSVVLGGNPYRQEDRLGPRLQTEAQHAVWPISAGSWALRNELIYLKQHPEVVKNIDEFIFVLNSEDFQQASSWGCEITHPRSYPISATYYAIKKYLYDFNPCTGIKADLAVEDGDWKEDLKNFIADENTKGKPITFFLYPTKNEMKDKKLAASKLELHAPYLMPESNSTIKIFSVARDPRWETSFYRDSIHPTVEGTKTLANIINSPNESTNLN